MKSKIILGEAIPNTGRKFGSNQVYHPATICSAFIGDRPALFTHDQLQDAMARAKINPEDVPKRSPWWKFW